MQLPHIISKQYCQTFCQCSLYNCYKICYLWQPITYYQYHILPYLSAVVHTGVEVHRMDSEMSRLVERPWLQLMCCAVCLPCGRNFRWRRRSPSGSECWMVCHRWTPEIEFNKRLSSLIIRLANYSVTTSLIYNWYYRRYLGFQW